MFVMQECERVRCERPIILRLLYWVCVTSQYRAACHLPPDALKIKAFRWDRIAWYYQLPNRRCVMNIKVLQY